MSRRWQEGSIAGGQRCRRRATVALQRAGGRGRKTDCSSGPGQKFEKKEKKKKNGERADKPSKEEKENKKEERKKGGKKK